MKMAIIMLLATITMASAKSYSQNVTLDMKNTRMELVFNKIEKLSGYSFIYEKNLLRNIGKVDVSVYNKPLNEAMNMVLNGQPLEYTISDKFIVISPKATQIKNSILISPVIQFIKITGVVKDTSGVTIPNVSILNKNTGKVSVTNMEGAFTLDANAGDVLLFSSVGYVKQEIKVGAETKLNVVLKEEKNQLDQVVVTALGIKKSVRSLTYNVQELKGEELTKNKDANFINSLTGKVAGVTINASSSGIGGGTRVVMRGTKSISLNNNVLYVVDGIPIPNSNGGAVVTDAFKGSVTGEGISSLNADDIESISALTGPSATALYGNQGANGVIVVTTKKGSVGKLKITLSNNTDFYNPFILPKFQNTYGQADPQKFESWGAKLAEPSSYNPKDFFETGYNISNSVSLSGGSEKSQTFFSAATNNSKGIIPDNKYNRYNFYLRHTANLTDKFTVDFNAMYVRTSDNNMIAQGQYQNPILPLYLFPAGDDIRKYEVYSRYNADRKISTQFWPYGNLGLGAQNPYWVAKAQTNMNNLDRYMLSGTAKYKIFDWFDVTGRVRVDNSNLQNEIKLPAGTDGVFASQYGYYSTGKTGSKNLYFDLIASIRRKITNKINFLTNFGGSYQDDKIDGLTVFGNLTQVANAFTTLDNMSPQTTPVYSQTQLQSTFATAQFDYDKWLYLDATGRYEWPSQLPKDFANQSSYFYPSLGLSAVISDVVKMPKAISFIKVRASYAEVGSPPKFGVTNPTYSINANGFRPAPFPEYLPERTKSYEAGLDLKFFNNALTFSGTIYKSNTTNQLLTKQITTGSIYSEFSYNAGDIQNKGIEASLGYTLNLNQLTWNTSAVFSLNRNKINRLSEGFVNRMTGEVFGKDSLSVSALGSLQNILTLGGSMSDLYVSQVLREDNQGHLWISPTDGSIQTIKIPQRYIGRTTPDYNIGWKNTFTYKGIDLSFLIDARVGGVGVSATQSIMDAYGASQQTADDRDNGGVMIYGKKYSNVQNFYNVIGGASGGSVGLLAYYVYSATNVRLREASIGYTIPGKLLKGKLESIRVALTGRNLFMFYNKAPFDPESTASTGTYYQGIDYFQQPSYRSFGFNVSVRF
ncbi:SusC/RagA family TonB-linked outer membrane protein [Pedobacter nototheniae]|uniref:SusC/RagA family TonB-linked outer membrane protein n=1 Tax=Pedobacter nototheniae TaxID=2488994 RepID=UPI00292EF910|nr:SusC/RagA family TonB-linked outer membrane protein [Pedobacter nototheniae]